MSDETPTAQPDPRNPPRESGPDNLTKATLSGPALDEVIARDVRLSLWEDTWLDARAIEIEVHDSVVTLNGYVRDWMAYRYAWDDAWETDGVRGVVTRLEVGPIPGGIGDSNSPNAPTEG